MLALIGLVNTTQASLELAKQPNQPQQDQYWLDTLLYSQVLNTEKSLPTTEQTHRQTAYSWVVAKLNYENVMGIFNVAYGTLGS